MFNLAQTVTTAYKRLIFLVFQCLRILQKNLRDLKYSVNVFCNKAKNKFKYYVESLGHIADLLRND
jgi:hypothetical protein